MAKKRKRGAEKADFSDEDAVLAEVAEALEEDVTDLRIKEDMLTSFKEGTVYRVSTRGGRREWCVAEGHEAAYNLAVAIVTQDLEDEPEELFSPEFLESHIDMDRLKDALEMDMQDSEEDDLRELDAEDFWREAEGEGMEPRYTVTVSDLFSPGPATKQLPGTFASEDDATDAAEDWKSAMIETHVSDEDDGASEDDFDYEVEPAGPTDDEIATLAEKRIAERLKDPMGYLADIHGDKEAVEQAIKIAGINVEEAADDAVNSDGWEHFLSRYDGNAAETASGFVYWRES